MTAGYGPRIALVDPETSLYRLARQSLKTAGFEVAEFHETDLVTQAIAVQKVDLVLIDADVSGPGLNLIGAIRSSPKNFRLPVIVMGSLEASISCVVWLEAGADGYLSRPFSNDVLVARVRALLRRSQ